MQNSLSDDLYKRCCVLEQKDRLILGVINEQFFKNIEKALSIVISDDFYGISQKVAYFGFSFFEFWEPLVGNNRVVKNNLELRKQYAEQSAGKSDMSHILVLADDDGGSVFMITQDSPEKPTPVIWCDYGDMYYYSIHGEFQNPHDEWPSFAAFFEYLVEQAEEELAEG